MDQQPFWQGFLPVMFAAYEVRYGLHPADFNTGNNLIDKSNGDKALKYGGTYRYRRRSSSPARPRRTRPAPRPADRTGNDPGRMKTATQNERGSRRHAAPGGREIPSGTA